MMQVVVAGGTGLIGGEVLSALAARPEVQATALVRRATGRPGERVFNFEPPGDYALLGTPELPCDVLLCCVGTTIRKAGSQHAFQKVDLGIPVALATALARRNSQAVFGLISSTGAAKPTGFYLRTKAAAEAGVISSGLRYVILRPSLLLGDRQELRWGERVGAVVAKPLFGLTGLLGLNGLEAVAKVRPIAAAQVAAVLITACLDRPPVQGEVLEGLSLQR